MGHESEKVPRFFLSTLGLCSGLATMGSAAFSESILRYDSVYLTCSKKLTGSQLSLPHTGPALAFWRPYANKTLAAPDHHESVNHNQ